MITTAADPPPPAAPEPNEALVARALALRFRDPGQALALAQRAAASATGASGRRRASAAVGACLGLFPVEAPTARTMLLGVLEDCRAAGDDHLACAVLNEVAALLNATTEYEQALRHLDDALALSRRLGRRDEEARALRLTGSAHIGTGAFQTALAVLLDALRIHEQADPAPDPAGAGLHHAERGMLFGEIGVVYSNLDQFERAISFYRTALQLCRRHYPARAPRLLYRMGIAADELRDTARAEAYYRRCIATAERLADTGCRGLGLFGLAGTLLTRGGADEAERAAEEALRVLEPLPAYRAHYADALWVRGDVHLHRGAQRAALESYERARALFLEHRRPAAHLSHLHERFYRAYRALGEFALALEHHEHFHRLQTEHMAARASARMSEMMVQFDTERAMKDREISHLRNVELEREVAERRAAGAALARAKAELEATNRDLRALTVRDPLTGLFNRRHLDARFAEAFALARRGVQPLSVMICDVDDFKRINDTFSHAVGDEVLRAVATLLRQNVRESDVVARYGGEEFVVLYPGARLQQAAAAAEKLRRVVSGHPWARSHPELAVTITFGVAEAGDHADHEKLLQDADLRLYAAKQAGKNRVGV